MLDCIIIGAGPGGGSAAYHLAKRGRKVLILEKAKLPRYKPCGGGVSPAIAQWFDFDFSPAIAAKVDRVKFTWQQGDPVEAQLTTEPMWMVRRDAFDHYLLEQGQRIGVEVRDETEVRDIKFNGTAWQAMTSQGNFTATYLIGADGAMGVSAKLLGFKQETRTSAVLEIDAPPEGEAIARFDFGSLKDGFIWDFPKTTSHALSGAIVKGKGKSQVLQKQLTDYAVSRGIEAGQMSYHEFAASFWAGNHPRHKNNALVVGDAAGLADPLLVEGIRPAIWSGIKAAEAIDQALAGREKALENYSQILKEQWGKDMGYAQMLSGLFYRFPQKAYNIGVKPPAASKIMSKILCGELRYSDVTDQAVQFLRKRLLGRGG